MARNPWTGVDAIEADTLDRLQGIYADALTQAVKNQKAFLKKVKDVDDGKIKPPYTDPEKIKKWREGFVREQLRQQAVIDGIMEDINRAGEMAAGTIKDASADIYTSTRDVQVESLVNESKKWLNRTPNFAMYNKRQIGVLLQEKQSPFSKIAYQNLGKNDAIRRRLQNEMAIAIINGESQEKMMKRISDVVGNAFYNAKRTAQTERTRIQAQATHETATEAHAMGIRTYKQWSTRMVNSRDNHIALNGAIALTNELFKYSASGAEVPYPMMYPADPSAPASEVVNCHCVYIEHVLLDDEDVQNGRIVHIDPDIGRQIAESSIGFEAYNEEVLKYLQHGEQKQTKKRTKKTQEEKPKQVPQQAMINADMLVTGTQKKKAQIVCDYVNGIQSSDPACNELFTHMADWSNDLGIPVKVSYTNDNHAVGGKVWGNGRIAEISIKIPKMDGDLLDQASTTVHEYTHFINLTRGSKARNGTYTHVTDTTGVIDGYRAKHTGISERLKNLFKKYDDASRAAEEEVRKEYSVKLAECNQKIHDALDKRDYTLYRQLDKERDKIYSEQNLAIDYASRKAMNGFDGIEDIVDAIENGHARDSGKVRYGHGAKYYRDRTNADNETLSNYCGIMMCCPEAAQVLKEEFPEICEGMHNIVVDMLKGV